MGTKHQSKLIILNTVKMHSYVQVFCAFGTKKMLCRFVFHIHNPIQSGKLHLHLQQIHVMGGRFDQTGPLACIIPFPVLCWMGSDKYPNLRLTTPMCSCEMFPIKQKLASTVLQTGSVYLTRPYP